MLFVLQINSNGQFNTKSTTHEAEVLFISPYQVVCVLPTASSYYITVEVDGTPITVTSPVTHQTDSGFAFMAYDSACYMCNAATQTCEKKQQVCVNSLQLHKVHLEPSISYLISTKYITAIFI